jgi:lantibiotic modifying enzyme
MPTLYIMSQTTVRDYVDQCRVVSRECGRRLSSYRVSGSWAPALESSLITTLRAELKRLVTYHTHLQALPASVRDKAGRLLAQGAANDVRERLVRLRASGWCAAICELLERLAHDWPVLERVFGLKHDTALCAISEPLGDFHAGGRSVFRLQFEDGRSLIYKPRTVGGERTFASVVDWFRRSGFSLTLKSSVVLAQSGYGWTNYVTAVPCHTVEEVEAFCERQGAFLGIFYTLCGSDCIECNVIGNGADPVWVDTECMCGLPMLQRELRHVPIWIRESVLATGLIFHGNDRGEPPRAHSGLNVHSNLPRSTIYAEYDVLRPRYRDAVIRGFATTYDWIQAHRDEWTGPGGVLAWWTDERVRFLPRGTAAYSVLSDMLLFAPEHLACEVMGHVQETLRRTNCSVPWPEEMIALEMQALSRGDIPYWSALACGRDLYEGSSGVVRNVAVISGLERARARIVSMSLADLKNQIWLIDTHLRLPNVPSRASGLDALAPLVNAGPESDISAE